MNFDTLNSLKERAAAFIDEKWNGLFRGNLLRVTCFAGLVLLALLGGAFVSVYIAAGGGAKGAGETAGFYRLLRDYDRKGEAVFAAIR